MSLTEVRTRDGLRLAVEDVGPRAAPAVIFVHGIAQDRTAFAPVLQGPLADRLRLIAFDVRGHGDSDKPEDAYADLGDDLEAVLRELDLDRVVVAPWSYGGVVTGDYVRKYGASKLSGVFAIAAAVAVGRSSGHFFGPGMMDHVRGLISKDPAVYEASARAFAAGCGTAPPAYVEGRVAAMLRVPAYVRRALLTRDDDFVSDLSGLRLTAFHGAADTVVLPALSERLTPHLQLLPNVGHLAFLEPALGPALTAFLDA